MNNQSTISQFIPGQFPRVYQENDPTFLSFVQAYYEWIESSDNDLSFSRQIYEIKDIDTTMDRFLVHFKNKYLNNIQFDTSADIKQIIKHALDIYRSKGTLREMKLLFQLVYGVDIDVYLPSTDLMKLSDGEWYTPTYLELSLSDNNINLVQKEVKGQSSGAVAYIDNVIRKMVKGTLLDVAYISAIYGQFQTNEKIIPVDNSISVTKCPFIIGSLESISFNQNGIGFGHTPGDIVTLQSNYGEGATFRVNQVADFSGSIYNVDLKDGGYGYANPITGTVTYISSTQTWTWPGHPLLLNDHVYFTGGVMPAGYISGQVYYAVARTNNTFQLAESVGGSIVTTTDNGTGPITAHSASIIHISNNVLTISNVALSSNAYYLNWHDTVTQNLRKIVYSSTTGAAWVPGDDIYSYSESDFELAAGSGDKLLLNDGTTILEFGGLQSGHGQVLRVQDANTLITSMLSGTFAGANHLYDSITSIMTVPSAITDVTATGKFIANSMMYLTLNNITGIFLDGEEVRYAPNSLLADFPEVSASGNINFNVSLNLFELTTNWGRFLGGTHIVGTISKAEADIGTITLNVGVESVLNTFYQSPWSPIYSNNTTGYLTNLFGGTDVAMSYANLIYMETVSINTDIIGSYLSKHWNDNAYGFPGNPTANISSGTIGSCFSYANLEIGRLNSISVDNIGQNYNYSPFIVIEEPKVDAYDIHDVSLILDQPTSGFIPGEEIVQTGTGARGILKSSSNSTQLDLTRMYFSNTNSFTLTGSDATDLVLMNGDSLVMVDGTTTFELYHNTTYVEGVLSGSTTGVYAIREQGDSMIMGNNAVVSVTSLSGVGIITDMTKLASGFGYIEGETVTIKNNEAFGSAVTGLYKQGIGSGYYRTKGSNLSDVKKLFDGDYWQNFSYEVVSPILMDKYSKMLDQVAHVAGTKRFGRYRFKTTNAIDLSVTHSKINL